jgi:hypothetical protein
MPQVGKESTQSAGRRYGLVKLVRNSSQVRIGISEADDMFVGLPLFQGSCLGIRDWRKKLKKKNLYY